MMLKEENFILFSLRALCDSHSFVPYNFFILISETHFFDSVPFISYAAYLQAPLPGGGKNREDIILVRLKGKVNHKPCASLTAKTKKEAKDKRKK